MKRPSRLDYAYAVGRVRALENNLIPRALFWESAEAKDLSSTMKAIFDAGAFLKENPEIQTTEELDEFLANEEENLTHLISELLLEDDIFRIVMMEDRLGAVYPLVKSLEYAFIRDYIRHKIDLSNLKILSRVKYAGLPKEQLERQIVAGGFLEEKLLLDGFELTFTKMGERLYTTPYGKVWNRAVDALEERETFVSMECGIEDFLMKYLQKAKHIVFGPEPIFAYALARKRELRLVRLLGAGKLNKIPPEILKERISETYV